VEAILTRAKMKNALENQAGLEVRLVAALEDFIRRLTHGGRAADAVAVLECTSKSLLPEDIAPWIARDHPADESVGDAVRMG